jgi:hypothetical protein
LPAVLRLMDFEDPEFRDGVSERFVRALRFFFGGGTNRKYHETGQALTPGCAGAKKRVLLRLGTDRSVCFLQVTDDSNSVLLRLEFAFRQGRPGSRQKT